MQLVSLITPVLLIVAASSTAWIPQTVTCEGTYPKHKTLVGALCIYFDRVLYTVF